jgi:hypothetical protein
LECFQKNWARKFTNACPHCKQQVRKSTLVRVDECGVETDRRGDVTHKGLDSGLDSIRRWKQQERGTPGEGILACALWAGRNTYTIYDFKLDIGGGQIDETSKMTKLFAKVFHPILFMDGVSDKEEGLPEKKDCHMSEFINLAFKDKSLALRCLYALSTERRWEIWRKCCSKGMQTISPSLGPSLLPRKCSSILVHATDLSWFTQQESQ